LLEIFISLTIDKGRKIWSDGDMRKR